MANDDSGKWIIEPLMICPLDPTAFLRKELIEVRVLFFEGMIYLNIFVQFKNSFQFGKVKETIEDENGIKQAKSVDNYERFSLNLIEHFFQTSVLSLKLLLKLVNYYDEMLTFTFLKEEVR